MRAATLDTQITILQAVNTRDEVGEPITSWSEVCTVFAKRTSRPGREFFQAGRVVSESRQYFLIRHRSDLNTHMRVEHNGTQYEITSVMGSEKRGESLQLECQAVA